MNSIKLTFRIPFFLIILFLSGYSASAQETTNGELTRPFQFTFVYPVGTNGISAGNYVNNVSINMLAGLSGGVKGAELGSLVNVSLGSVDGLQAAGLVNTSLGYMNGLQMSGLANFNKGELVGVQASGLANLNTHKVNGVQMGGLVNVATKTVDGGQFAGLVNVSAGSTYGAQLAGLINVSAGDTDGAQLSGIANVSAGKLDGVQIGLANYAKSVKGFQLGLLNITESVEKGAVLGLFSFVRDGYRRVELETNETFYLNAAFKSGTSRLYTIYTVSFKTDMDKTYWAPGIGLGTLMPISQKMNANIDLIARQVNEDEGWTEELNMWNTLKINFSYLIGERLEIYGGPSMNVSVSGIKDLEGNLIGESFSPDWGELSSHAYKKNKVKSYIGFNLGIRL